MKKPVNAQIGLKISEEDKQKLEIIAEEKGWSLSMLVREAIKEFLNEKGDKECQN